MTTRPNILWNHRLTTLTTNRSRGHKAIIHSGQAFIPTMGLPYDGQTAWTQHSKESLFGMSCPRVENSVFDCNKHPVLTKRGNHWGLHCALSSTTPDEEVKNTRSMPESSLCSYTQEANRLLSSLLTRHSLSR